MVASHSITQFLCSECSFDLSQEEEVVFATEADYKKHMLENHATSFDPVDLPLLLNLGEQTIVEPVSCPLCLNDRSLIRVEHDEHIAIHLHSFSLRALPWDFDLDDGAASAGSSDSTSCQGPQPVVEDSDDEDTAVLPGALDEAVSVLVEYAEALGQEKNNAIQEGGPLLAYRPVFQKLLRGSVLWEAVAHVDASQKQKCHLLVTRIGDNLKQLLAFAVRREDSTQEQDLYTNIEFDAEALEACVSQATRQDHDLWQEAFETLPAKIKSSVKEMMDEDEINSRSVPEQLDNLLKLSWNIQEGCNQHFGVDEQQLADDMVESFQVIGDDEFLFLSPQTNLPWGVVLAPMKVLLTFRLMSLFSSFLLWRAG